MVNVGSDYEALSAAKAMVNSDDVARLWIRRSLRVRLNPVMAERERVKDERRWSHRR